MIIVDASQTSQVSLRRFSDCVRYVGNQASPCSQARIMARLDEQCNVIVMGGTSSIM